MQVPEQPQAGTPEPEPPTDEEVEVAVEEVTATLSPEAIETTKSPYEIRGYTTLSYRGRWGGDDSDNDVYSYLSINGGRPEEDDVTFHVFGRMSVDFDGNNVPDDFYSLNDIEGGSFDWHVYEAFVDLRRSLAPEFMGIQKVRIGRQNVWAGYTYLLDGIRLDSFPIEALGNLRISAYGGKPELLYEESRSGDWLGGVDLDFRPFEGTRIDVRYAYVRDENEWVDSSETDNYIALAVSQRFGENVYATVEWNTIDVATRDVRLRVNWAFPDEDLNLNFSYMYQNSIERQFTSELDPFYAVVGPSYAYHQFDLLLSKLFGSNFGVDVGFDGRFLHDSDDEAPFNRQYARPWVTLSTYDWPWESLDFSLTGDYWFTEDDEMASLGFEVTWRHTADFRLSTGVYYSLYKYDLFTVDEREDATTLFLRARWRIDENFRLDGRYEFETGDEGDYHTVWVGLTWSF